MYISHSLLASAVILSFSSHTGARFTEQGSDTELGLAVTNEPSKLQGILQRWPLNKFFGKWQEGAGEFIDVQCPTDDRYIELLDSAPITAV
ncbi:hypothetical protein BU23DRAFT_15733 [Bimuria novae-zelandiae CBS 107.79]|uniref:Uncharacterized protein n=1 Tax=Bimuria novae-zelandiae CBS 107.79 TaxID=1447943 RepID=A0A6A5VI99_9PLEO|nr:hypothetical protein BU23DRAFT_15733 [Bimuria novae-zelandiae CBS 107.79]